MKPDNDRKEILLKRIDELLEMRKQQKQYDWTSGNAEITHGLITIMGEIYSDSSERIAAIKSREPRIDSTLSGGAINRLEYEFQRYLVGVLANVKSDIESGLISNIRQEMAGEIIGDFLTLANVAASENQKNVAGVLASAAFEDALKKCAEYNGIEKIRSKALDTVIKNLESKKLIKSETVWKYKKLRDDALHAQWDDFEMADVKGLISYVETFMETHF